MATRKKRPPTPPDQKDPLLPWAMVQALVEAWTRPSRHDDQEKIGPTKFPAKAFYQKRKLVVTEEVYLRTRWNGSQNAVATPPLRW